MKSTQTRKDFSNGLSQLIHTYQYGQLLQNETRLNILMYLRMNGSLSFSQLTDLVGKSKSTVHHHLNKMIQGGLIQEVETNGPRGQFDPKYYELVSTPKAIYTFDDISRLPLEQQTEAFLTTAKLSRNTLYYFYQIINQLTFYLDAIEKVIIDDRDINPVELQRMWDGSSNRIKDQPIKLKDIFYYLTQMSENVYSKYIEELKALHERMSNYRKQEEKQGGSKKRTYFINIFAAPLGKQYLLKSEEDVK